MASAPHTTNANLAALVAAGTAPWLDQIRRGLIASGELARLRDECSLRGVTSNPAIFEQAILGSDDYDDALARTGARGSRRDRALRAPRGHRRAGRRRRAARRLRRVRRRLRLLRGRTDARRRHRGHARAGARLLGAPGPPQRDDQDPRHAGRRPRDRAGDLRGHQRQRHAAVRRRALRRRSPRPTSAGSSAAQPRDCRSTSTRSRASSSRASTPRSTSGSPRSAAATSPARPRSPTRAPPTPATSRSSCGERFAALRAAGAHVQRPLWASTGVKNPAYPETMYVDGLIAPDTVNTMPMKTLLAVAERGTVVADTAREDAEPALAALAHAGHRHERRHRDAARAGDRGVRRADEQAARGHRERAADGPDRAPRGDRGGDRRGALGGGGRARRARRSSSASRGGFGRRTSRCGAGPGVPEIGDRLGWLTISDAMAERADELVDFARGCAADGLTDAVLLGMGGSSLAPEVLWRTFGAPEDALDLHVLDSTDPAAILDVQETLDLDHTLFIVSTKSGGTIETLSLFKHFHSLVARRQPLRRDHRPGQLAARARARARLPRELRERPQHRRALLGAVAVRARARGADRGARARAARARGAGRAGLRALRLDAEQPRAVAGPRDRRARAPRPRQADLRRRRQRLELRPVGRAAGRRKHRQAGPRDPAGGRRAAA